MGAHRLYDYPSPDEVRRLVDELGIKGTARHLGIPYSTFYGHWEKVRDGKLPGEHSSPVRDVEAAGVYEQKDGRASVVSAPREDAPWTVEELLEQHNLDPEEWEVVRVRANAWNAMTSDKAIGDNRIVTMHQLRLELIRRDELLQIPDPSDWTPPPKPRERRRADGEPRKIVICGDHHAPHHDETLHRLFLDWLRDEKPDEGVILGDLCDFSSISRHRRGKRLAPKEVNPCLRAAMRILQDYRHASPDTFWTILPGNHDDRLDHIQIDNAPGIYGVKPGGGEDLDGNPTSDALSLRNLLFLDELGIELIEEDFNRAKYLLGRKLTLRHGYLSGKNAATNMLSKVTRSSVQGHTHRLRLIYKTEHSPHDPDEPTVTRLAAEAGCMAEIADGLGYGDEPDWQQGFLVAHLWDNDDFTLTPVPYVPGRLLWPGRIYRA